MLNKGEEVPLSLSTISTESDSWVPQLITDGLSTANEMIKASSHGDEISPASTVMTCHDNHDCKAATVYQKTKLSKKKNDHLNIISFNS